MRRDEFDKLTDEMVRAFTEYTNFMSTFVRSGSQLGRVMNQDHLRRAQELSDANRQLEHRWFMVARGIEPLED